MALSLALGAEMAHAREAVKLPLSCEIRSGRLVVRQSAPAVYELASPRKSQMFSTCEGSGRCRRIAVFRFDVACGGEVVPWVELAAALVTARGGSAMVRNNRLLIRQPASTPRGGEGCEANENPVRAFIPGEIAQDVPCQKPGRGPGEHYSLVLPVGFAPIIEVGARLIEIAPSAESQRPSSAALADASRAGAGLSAPIERIEDSRSKATNLSSSSEPPRPATPVNADARGTLTPEDLSRLAAIGNPHVSAEERWADPPARTAIGDKRPEPVTEEVTYTAASTGADASNTEAVEAPLAARAAAENQGEAFLPGAATNLFSPRRQTRAAMPEPPAQEHRLVSVSGWSSTVLPAGQNSESMSPLDLQPLEALSALATRVRDMKLEREITVALMGLALLSGMLTGMGWYGAHLRRTRFARGTREEGRAVAFRPASELLVPAEEVMCAEMCKSAHSLLRQIDSKLETLQGVAPLRRVLQKEMRHLEQFLAAVMTAAPAESEEWRRMRNRLQRIVKELHRLKDIVEGAQRSIAGAGFTGREPPRDKHEAYELLGVNADVSAKTLKKLVEALRACWHPDLAKDELDRQAREERMKRINIAWDIITEKRQEA